MPLTDNQQAIITLISSGCIAIGALSVPAGVSPYVAVAFEIVGVIGLTLKEFLGTASQTVQSMSNGASNNTTTNSALAAGAGSNSSPPQLPALPAGFSVAAAKAAGFSVYENTAGNVVLVYQGQEETIFGNTENGIDLTTYTQL